METSCANAYFNWVAPDQNCTYVHIINNMNSGGLAKQNANIGRKLMKFLSLSSINRDYFNHFCGMKRQHFINTNELWPLKCWKRLDGFWVKAEKKTQNKRKTALVTHICWRSIDLSCNGNEKWNKINGKAQENDVCRLFIGYGCGTKTVRQRNNTTWHHAKWLVLFACYKSSKNGHEMQKI